jgi:general secretion pathway protein I
MMSNRGFTLLECVVALAILAVAMTASLRAAGSVASSTDALKTRTLASWVAQNRLAELRATGAWPSLGQREGHAEQGGRGFAWRERVQPTPNPLFRRVDVQVFDQEQRPLITMTGFLARPLR